MRLFRLLLAAFFLFWAGNVFAGELLQAPCAIQMSSKVSDGKYSLAEIARICRENNFKVVIPADRDVMRWEYGLWPLRNILKRTVEQDSVLKYGVKRYLEEFARLQSDNRDLVLIPAVESAPFYYWKGDPFHLDLEIRDWHKHIITIGLDNAQDWEYLPVVGNKRGLAGAFGSGYPKALWPAALILAGIFCLRRRTYDYKDESGRRLGPYAKNWKRAGIFFVAAGLVFLANGFPFCSYRFDQYRDKAGIRPYQEYIDYAGSRGGLTFWAHPEASNIEKSGFISIRTDEHWDSLLQARDYTGFAVFFEGFKTVGKVGGVWDQLLIDYCKGKRKKPTWAIGALSFDSVGKLEDYLKDVRTVLLLPALNKAEALKALKSGRMYSAMGRNSANLVLSEFSVTDTGSSEKAFMGGEVGIKTAPEIKIVGNLLNGQSGPFKIKLIRDGRPVETFEGLLPADIVYSDKSAPIGKSYYRLEIQGPEVVAIANPIFTNRTEAR